jgi:hypothetical protein
VIEAPKTAVLSSEPRKRSWKAWLLGLACVVAVTIVALLPETPKKEPVAVWFVRSTNELGEKKLVFEGTTGIPGQVAVFAGVFPGAVPPAKTQALMRPWYDYTFAASASGTNFYFTLKAPPKDVRFYVMWESHEIRRPATGWGRFRLGCYSFFNAHNMPRLARRFDAQAGGHYIPSAEIKE